MQTIKLKDFDILHNWAIARDNLRFYSHAWFLVSGDSGGTLLGLRRVYGVLRKTTDMMISRNLFQIWSKNTLKPKSSLSRIALEAIPPKEMRN